LHQAVGPHRGEVRWRFLETEMSRVCFAATLGVGKQRLRNASHGEIDMRFASSGNVPCVYNGMCFAPSISMALGKD